VQQGVGPRGDDLAQVVAEVLAGCEADEATEQAGA
jgi:hypothetical protein